MNALKLITLYLPETYLQALDHLVGERYYPNRAEAIRLAIRDLLSDEVWSNPSLSEDRMRKLNQICVEWNKRNLDSKEAMYKIWKLFQKENLEAWKKQGT